MSVVEKNLSDLLNKPTATLARLGSTRQLVLHRRDDEDLVLTTAARAAQDSDVMTATSHMFSAMARTTRGHDVILDVLPYAFPWVRYLPTRDLREFATELVETLSAAAEWGNTAAVAQLLTEWRHTAEVHADPELYAALTVDSGDDYGPAHEPGSAA